MIYISTSKGQQSLKEEFESWVITAHYNFTITLTSYKDLYESAVMSHNRLHIKSKFVKWNNVLNIIQLLITL